MRRPRRIDQPASGLAEGSSPSYEYQPPVPAKPHLVKTRPCKHHLRGLCKYGNDCCFTHGLDDLSPEIRQSATALPLSPNELDISRTHGLSSSRALTVEAPGGKGPSGRLFSIGGASTAASSSGRASLELDPAILAAVPRFTPQQKNVSHPVTISSNRRCKGQLSAHDDRRLPEVADCTLAGVPGRLENQRYPAPSAAVEPRMPSTRDSPAEPPTRIVETLLALMEDLGPLESMSAEELSALAATALLRDPPLPPGCREPH